MSPRIQGGGDIALPTEGAILSKIETALENAIEQRGLEASESPVKRQKYLYLAVDEFANDGEDPITYSWFKWGASALAGPSGPDTGKTFRTNNAEAEPLIQTSLPEYEEFFLDGPHDLALEDWWEADFLDFLQQFYSESAPPQYQELYLDNIRLLKIIDDIEHAMFYERDPAREDTYDEVCELTADIKGEVLIHSEFENDYEIVSDFTALLEDVVMSLVDVSEDDLIKGHQTAISELRDHYTNHVWLILAHNMSLSTATGPNSGDIYNSSPSELSALRDRFESEHNTKREICKSVGLIPDLSDYKTESSDFEEKASQFLQVGEGRSSAE
ncbi:hypothetical protein EXE43_14800 [Halorubrum sp. SS5]|nr:hypothetical protein EXE43_14800 [Halorubrum sp. SS5]